LFPDRQSMIKRANALWATLMVAPIVFILVSVSTVGEAGRGLGGLDTGFLILLVIVSVADVVLIFYTQKSQRFSASLMRRGPLSRTYKLLSTGSVLCESIGVYGLVLTLLSGSLIYIVAFSSASWLLLIWVRTRFTANLKNMPDIGTNAV